uniref:Uncharacterized protein n=1 Tax=Fagus sylvatica TaxID=28930 RepID=A0A2N9H335_FAGSY
MGVKTSFRIIIIPMLIIFLFLSSTYTMVVAEPNNVVPRAKEKSKLRALTVPSKTPGKPPLTPIHVPSGGCPGCP